MCRCNTNAIPSFQSLQVAGGGQIESNESCGCRAFERPNRDREEQDAHIFRVLRSQKEKFVSTREHWRQIMQKLRRKHQRHFAEATYTKRNIAEATDQMHAACTEVSLIYELQNDDHSR